VTDSYRSVTIRDRALDIPYKPDHWQRISSALARTLSVITKRIQGAECDHKWWGEQKVNRNLKDQWLKGHA